MEEVSIFHELVEFLNTVKETSGNFTGEVAVHILNREKDRVTNEFSFIFASGKIVELLNVDTWESNVFGHLVDLLVRVHLRRLLRRSHHGVGREVLLVHNRLTILLMEVTLISVIKLSITLVVATSLLVASSAALVILSTHVVAYTALVAEVLVHVVVLLSKHSRVDVIQGTDDPRTLR